MPFQPLKPYTRGLCFCRPCDENEIGPPRTVTVRQFYAHRMHTRPEPEHFNALHRWGRLGQVIT